MDGLILLAKAREAGLIVQADGDLLRIRGPRRLEPLVRRLLEHKPAVLAVLADRPVVESSAQSAASRAESERFRFTDCLMNFGDICAGWKPAGWANGLRRKADCCEVIRPDIAQYYRSWAADIECRLPTRRPEHGDRTESYP